MNSDCVLKLNWAIVGSEDLGQMILLAYNEPFMVFGMKLGGNSIVSKNGQIAENNSWTAGSFKRMISFFRITLLWNISSSVPFSNEIEWMYTKSSK